MATNSKFSADLGIQTDADLQVDGNVTVSGNLTVNGTQTTVNSTTTSVEDSMLELANANLSSDTLDIGIYGNYDDGLGDGVSEYTGFFRDASDSTWKLFDGLEAEPTTTVNTSGTGYTLADLQVGDLTATTLTATNALTGSSITYPTSDGTNGQVLTTNGSGTLSFGDIPADATKAPLASPVFSGTVDMGTFGNRTRAFEAYGSNVLFDGGSDKIDLIIGDGSSAYMSIQTTDTASAMNIRDYSGNADLVTIERATGNVGVGTNAPDDLLHVFAGDSTATPHSISAFNIESASDVAMNFLTPNTSQAQIRFADPQDDGKGIIGYDHSSDYMFFSTNGPERLRLTSSGDMHLGASDSDVFFYLGSNGGLTGGNSSHNMRASGNQLMFNAGGASSSFVYEVNGSQKMNLASDGKLNVIPSSATDNYGMTIITGNSADTGIKIGRSGANNAMFGLAVVSNGTNSIGRLQFDGDGDVAFGDAANIELRDGNLVRIQSAFSNDTYATNRAVYAEDQGELGYNASVRASKTNITDVDDVSWLYNLNAKTFNKRKKIQGEKQSDGTYSYSYSDTEHSGITEYGFIAEDLESLAPELCFYGYTRDVDADGNELDTFTKGELQGIHYESMVAPMLKLIQNQKDEIDALEVRIATLESE